MLAERSRLARPHLYIAAIIAHREYESWFLAAAESVAGKRNLRADLLSPVDPKRIRDAKGWTGQLRIKLHSATFLTYILPAHALSGKLWHEIERLGASVQKISVRGI